MDIEKVQTIDEMHKGYKLEVTNYVQQMLGILIR